MLGKESTSDKPNRVVLIPVTTGSISEKAFDWYLKNERKSGDRVHVVHCPEVDIPVTALAETQLEFTPDVVLPEKLQVSTEESKSILDLYTKKLEENNLKGKMTSEVYVGSPGKDIIKVAQNDNASLIIMAKQGLGAFYRHHLRSVSDYVQKHTDVPVSVYQPNLTDATIPETPEHPPMDNTPPPSPTEGTANPLISPTSVTKINPLTAGKGSILMRLIGRQSSVENLEVKPESPTTASKKNPLAEALYSNNQARYQRELLRNQKDLMSGTRHQRRDTM